MRRQDYFRQELRGWLRLHEKGGKRHDVPAHHRAEEAVEAYLAAGGVDDAKAPLFQSVDRAGGLSGRPLGRRAVLAMIKRRAAAADLPPSTCCHTFRATGITAYLSNGGTLEHAQRIAGHASPKTTKLYDRTADRISLDGDRTHRDLGETQRAGPVQGQGVLPSSSTPPPSSRRRRGEQPVTRRTAVRAAAPRGLGFCAARPGPRGAGSAGCPTDRAGGTDRVCTEGGAPR